MIPFQAFELYGDELYKREQEMEFGKLDEEKKGLGAQGGDSHNWLL